MIKLPTAKNTDALPNVLHQDTPPTISHPQIFHQENAQSPTANHQEQEKPHEENSSPSRPNQKEQQEPRNKHSPPVTPNHQEQEEAHQENSPPSAENEQKQEKPGNEHSPSVTSNQQEEEKLHDENSLSPFSPLNFSQITQLFQEEDVSTSQTFNQLQCSPEILPLPLMFKGKESISVEIDNDHQQQEQHSRQQTNSEQLLQKPTTSQLENEEQLTAIFMCQPTEKPTDNALQRPDENQIETIFLCGHKDCSKSGRNIFKTAQTLKQHIKVKHENYRSNHYCIEHHLSFKNDYQLQKHRRIHHGKIYTCPVPNCKSTKKGKTFNSKPCLDRHLKTHGPKDHTCSKCGKGFTVKDNRNKHQRICKN